MYQSSADFSGWNQLWVNHVNIDVIVSTKLVLFKSGFGGKLQPRRLQLTPKPAPPPHLFQGYAPDSQNTCPNESLRNCGVFLYGVNLILILLCKVCEDMRDNYRNLEVRTHWCIDRFGLYDIASSYRAPALEFKVKNNVLNYDRLHSILCTSCQIREKRKFLMPIINLCSRE